MATDGRRTWFRLFGLLMALLLLGAACGGGDDDGDDDASGTDTTEASDEVELDRTATLRFAHSFGHNSFDPHKSPSAPGDAAWHRPVYDRLLTLVRTDDGTVDVGPQLAESFEVAEDGLSIEFVLRDDVVFHDGTKFDGEAVKANIERAKGPGSTVLSFLASVDTVEVVDPTHVVFNLNRPNPGLAYSLAADSIGMMVSPAAFESDLSQMPVGAGPFKLVSASRGAEVTYERFEEHYDPDAAAVQRLVIATIPDVNARMNGVRSGDYEAAYMANPLDVQSRDLESEGFHWVQELAPITSGLLFNTAMAPFDDVRVRRAVSMAMNRKEISEELLQGIAPPVYQPFAEGYLGHDPDLDEDPYDPAAARKLIEEAGVAGQKVTLLATATAPYDAMAQVAQQALGDIGLTVEVEPIAASSGIPTWLEGNHGFYMGTILAEPEPTLTLGRSYLAGHNVGGDVPPELAKLADDALALPLDSDEREEAYQEISAFLVENPIHLPLVQFSTVVLAREEVVNAEEMVKVVIGKLDFRGVGIAKK